jgi:LPPG:FO 2-phospho-L-lactate transferase
MMKVVALAGGVGGARLADGLAQALAPADLTVVVNTGDDFEHLGLRICPDLDTVCYTLAGMANPVTGWGRQAETWQAFENLVQLGGPDWFHLGDADLGTHLERSRRLREGQSLSEIMRDFCRAWGVGPTVLPMSDAPVSTEVLTVEGVLPFQEYFVRKQCQPRVTGFRFVGVETARPAPGVCEALRLANLIVICPSNPWVSIDPILAVPGLRAALNEGLADTQLLVGRDQSKKSGRGICLAVSPIIAGQTVKGPAAKMYAELGFQPSALAVARHYGRLLHGYVLDQVDRDLTQEIESSGIHVLATDILMRTRADRLRLAKEVLAFGSELCERHPLDDTVGNRPG